MDVFLVGISFDLFRRRRVCLNDALLDILIEVGADPPPFDAVALTDEFNTKGFQILEQDGPWLLSHGELTRMLGNFT